MTSEPYFPEHRHLLSVTTIRRSRMLPDAATGDVEVARGSRVSLLDTVARGVSPAPYKLVDAARFFGLSRRPEAVESLLKVSDGQEVNEGELLAQRRGKKLLSPIDGRVITIWRGQIVLQGFAETLDLQAGLNGAVIEVRVGRGAVLEGLGGVLQGVWGNDRRAVGSIKFEPSDGMESIFGGVLDTEYRGAIIITRRTLKPLSLQVIETQGLTGIIAPSMAPSMREAALKSSAAILLVEGFGNMRMSQPALQFLESVEGRQGSLDAVTPAALESRRPEMLVSVQFDPNDRPAAPNVNITLHPGLSVRLARGEQVGAMGVITHLPKTPILMDNGLRVACAQVELVTGEKITAPLANLEVTGA